jgi:Cu/Ag efflux pump CusA
MLKVPFGLVGGSWLVYGLGLLATGSGADVTHRIAAPVLGGMVTVLILSLLVFPVIYSFTLQFQERRKQYQPHGTLL